MKHLLLIILFTSFSLVGLAQSADSYFHGGAQSFINADLQGAIAQVQQGLAQYPNDPKLNELLKKLEEEQEKQQQQQQQNQDQQNQEEQEQQNQDQQQQDQQEQDNEEEQQDQQEGENQEQNEPQEQEGQQQQPREISKAEADKILQALAQKEKELLKEFKNKNHREAPLMIKTGKQYGYFFGLFFSFLFVLNAYSQDIVVDASLSETNIFSGEAVRLDLKVSGQSISSIERPSIPNQNGLRRLSNNTSSSQNFTYINGRPSVSYTYAYQFIAQAPGTYTFPKLEVSVNGKTYTTNEIIYKVLDPKTIDTGQAERSPDIYIRLEPSTKNPVVGEQVTADIVLYFKSEIEVSSYNASPGWKAEGFWKEDLENRQQAQTTSTIINGVRYQRALLLQYAIFPTKSGELTLSPYDLVVSVRQRNRRRDLFSFGLGQERKELSTLPVKIDVSPLPELNNATFSGGVGNFSITRSINPKEAFVGESVEIVTTISGNGNVPLILKPDYKYPESLEMYNPQEKSTITRSNRKIGGTKIFTDILIARNEGEFEIPAANIAYYNPTQKKYVSITLPKLELNAKRDPRAKVLSDNELRFNVKPITGLANWVSADYRSLHTSSWVWMLLIAPLFILGGAFFIKNYSEKMNSDTAFARSQKAKDKAFEELNKADGETDLKTGYNHIQKALSQFVSDKLDLPQAGLSIKELTHPLIERGESLIADEVKKLLEKCDTIAYAPSATLEGLEKDVEKTKDLIKKIGKLV